MGGIGGPPQQRRGADAEKKSADAAVVGAPAYRASGGRRACNSVGELTRGRRVRIRRLQGRALWAAAIVGRERWRMEIQGRRAR